jgi:hypothetical protein
MKNRLLLLIGSIITGAIVVACGGGGGSGTSTSSNAGGTAGAGMVSAADGSAMAYSQIIFSSLADSTSFSGTADIGGNIQVPSSGVTFPILVKAVSLDGSKINYGYVANNAQTSVPVNPLSTFVLAIASNGNPASISSASQLTTQSIASAKTAVNAIFTNIFSAFNVSTSIDLLTTSFSANHTGMDLVLDSMGVYFDAIGNPTLCTKISNQCKVFTLSSLDTSPISLSAQTIASINSVPFQACSTFINGLGSSSFATYNSGLYDASFLNSGLTSQAYSSAMAAKLSGVSASFNTPIYVGQDANNNHIFQFFVFNNGTNQYAGTQSMSFKSSGGNNCVMVGDQLSFWIQVSSQITSYTRVDGSFAGAQNPAGSPSVVTAAPITGLYFKAGGDGFGNSGALDNLVNQGSPPVATATTIQRLQFNLCDASNNCNTPLIELRKGNANNGFYYVPSNVNTIPVVSYSSINLNSPTSFYNGNANPIQVKMLDGNNTVQQTTYLKIRGGFISQAELQAVTLPSVSNATSILNTQSNLSAPSLSINIPTGTIVQSISLTSGPNNGTPTTSSAFVLSTSSLSSTMNQSINVATDNYRSIMLNGSTATGKPISVKYVFSSVSGSI